ncbi:MAG: methyltransferase domain-containing protein [Aeoliella sp.]
MMQSVASIPDLSLDEALARVDKCFDDHTITERKVDSKGVLEYYRQSDRAYRMFHSREGALHIGLTPDRNGEAGDVGHARHAELFAAELDAVSAMQAIEFGCGTGYNVRTLALQMAERQFLGVDLSERHIVAARKDAAGIANLEFQVANYENLSVDDASFDGVLAVETLCQTDDQSSALQEAFRILRPGGRMLVIDCFRNELLENLEEDLRRAALLVEKTAAVDAFALIGEWRELCESIGFHVRDVCDRSAETARDLARLYQMARRFFKMSLAVKVIRRAMPPLAVENAICGLLMPYTVGHGAHGYYSIVLEKP